MYHKKSLCVVAQLKRKCSLVWMFYLVKLNFSTNLQNLISLAIYIDENSFDFQE